MAGKEDQAHATEERDDQQSFDPGRGRTWLRCHQGCSCWGMQASTRSPVVLMMTICL